VLSESAAKATAMLDLDEDRRADVDKLLPLVYDDLRARARRYLPLGGAGEPILQPTVLVHEAYLKLLEGDARLGSRTHMLAVAAIAMRQVLIDHVRSRRRAKRGGGAVAVTLDESVAAEDPNRVDALALDEALDALAAVSPRQARVVELRFYGGLTVEEVAEALGVSRATAENDWTFAKAWLRRRLSRDGAAR
jgi:RNA polymerase sigma factor (TIGR02999 family)